MVLSWWGFLGCFFLFRRSPPLNGIPILSLTICISFFMHMSDGEDQVSKHCATSLRRISIFGIERASSSICLHLADDNHHSPSQQQHLPSWPCPRWSRCSQVAGCCLMREAAVLGFAWELFGSAFYTAPRDRYISSIFLNQVSSTCKQIVSLSCYLLAKSYPRMTGHRY